MSGMCLSQVKNEIIVPTLSVLGERYNSKSAVVLTLGTGLVESGYEYLVQLGSGVARSVFQIEEPTFDDVVNRMGSIDPTLPAKVRGLSLNGALTYREIAGNLYLAAAICRIKYALISAPLPPANYAYGLSIYHKQYYNTEYGSADPVKNTSLFAKAIAA